MKPTVVADEMFPEGAGPYMDLEEVPCWIFKTWEEKTVDLRGVFWELPFFNWMLRRGYQIV
jgi:hypothetical protein